jgi:predicted secreted acid phosphatase
MSSILTSRRNPDGSERSTGRLGRALAGTVVVAILAAVAPTAIQAAQCPAAREPRIPPAEEPVVNIDKHKGQLRKYQAGNYNDDLGLVFTDARAYVEQRADQVKRPAAVLDIDETSLSNWPNINANDFGFIKGGPCFEEPHLACGFDDWIFKASAPVIPPALDFFNAAIAKNVAVFFITGRTDSQRQATLWNLDRAGFQGWAGLRTRPDNDHNKSIVPFKSGERKKIEADSGYKIIANVGDQESDIDGGHTECGFKLPNPFYFIE